MPAPCCPGAHSAYSNWECYTALNRVCANFLMARTLSKALLDMAVLKYTWHMHANILINILSCATMLILFKRCVDVVVCVGLHS